MTLLSPKDVEMVATVVPTKPKGVDEIRLDVNQDPAAEGVGRNRGCCKRNLCWPSFKLLVYLVLLAFFSLILHAETIVVEDESENHQSEVRVSFQRPNNVTFPAVTICNNNGILKSKFCQMYPETCSRSTFDQELVVNLSSFYRLTSKMSKYNTITFGQSWQDFTKSCLRIHHKEDGNSECKDVREIFWPMNHQNCFTFLRGQDKLIGDYRKAAFWTVLDFHPEENVDNRSIVGGQLFIHDPSRRIPTGFPTSSYSLKPGKVYSFSLKQTNYQRLPPPYQSGCRIYEKNEFLISSDPSQEECYNKCLYAEFKSGCGCMPDPVPFFGRLNEDATVFCKPTNSSRRCQERMRSSSEEFCNKSCPIACTESTYSVKMDEVETPEYNSDMKDAKRNQASVWIKFETNEQKTYYEIPAVTYGRMFRELIYLYCGAVLHLSFLVIKTVVRMCRICRSDSKK